MKPKDHKTIEIASPLDAPIHQFFLFFLFGCSASLMFLKFSSLLSFFGLDVTLFLTTSFALKDS
jgi:uncharacterized membrane protein